MSPSRTLHVSISPHRLTRRKVGASSPPTAGRTANGSGGDGESPSTPATSPSGVVRSSDAAGDGDRDVDTPIGGASELGATASTVSGGDGGHTVDGDGGSGCVVDRDKVGRDAGAGAGAGTGAPTLEQEVDGGRTGSTSGGGNRLIVDLCARGSVDGLGAVVSAVVGGCGRANDLSTDDVGAEDRAPGEGRATAIGGRDYDVGNFGGEEGHTATIEIVHTLRSSTGLRAAALSDDDMDYGNNVENTPPQVLPTMLQQSSSPPPSPMLPRGVEESTTADGNTTASIDNAARSRNPAAAAEAAMARAAAAAAAAAFVTVDESKVDTRINDNGIVLTAAEFARREEEACRATGEALAEAVLAGSASSSAPSTPPPPSSPPTPARAPVRPVSLPASRLPESSPSEPASGTPSSRGRGGDGDHGGGVGSTATSPLARQDFTPNVHRRRSASPSRSPPLVSMSGSINTNHVSGRTSLGHDSVGDGGDIGSTTATIATSAGKASTSGKPHRRRSASPSRSPPLVSLLNSNNNTERVPDGEASGGSGGSGLSEAFYTPTGKATSPKPRRRSTSSSQSPPLASISGNAIDVRGPDNTSSGGSGGGGARGGVSGCDDGGGPEVFFTPAPKVFGSEIRRCGTSSPQSPPLASISGHMNAETVPGVKSPDRGSQSGGGGGDGGGGEDSFVSPTALRSTDDSCAAEGRHLSSTSPPRSALLTLLSETTNNSDECGSMDNTFATEKQHLSSTSSPRSAPLTVLSENDDSDERVALGDDAVGICLTATGSAAGSTVGAAAGVDGVSDGLVEKAAGTGILLSEREGAGLAADGGVMKMGSVVRTKSGCVGTVRGSLGGGGGTGGGICLRRM